MTIPFSPKGWVPFELNTGAISRGYRTSPYPADDISEYIKNGGGRLVLSSDAHRAEDIAFAFERYDKGFY